MKWKYLRDTFRNIYRRLPRDEKGALKVKPENFKSRWPYYAKLLFLVNHLHPRSLNSSDGDKNETTASTEEIVVAEMVEVTAPVACEPPPLIKISTPRISLAKVLQKYPDLQKSAGSSGSAGAGSNLAAANPKRHLEEIEEPAIVPGQKKIKVEANDNYHNDSVVEPLITFQHPISAATPQLMSPNSSSSSSTPHDDDYNFLISLYPYMRECNPAQKLKIRMKIQSLIFQELYNEEVRN